MLKIFTYLYTWCKLRSFWRFYFKPVTFIRHIDILTCTRMLVIRVSIHGEFHEFYVLGTWAGWKFGSGGCIVSVAEGWRTEPAHASMCPAVADGTPPTIVSYDDGTIIPSLPIWCAIFCAKETSCTWKWPIKYFRIRSESYSENFFTCWCGVPVCDWTLLRLAISTGWQVSFANFCWRSCSVWGPEIMCLRMETNSRIIYTVLANGDTVIQLTCYREILAESLWDGNNRQLKLSILAILAAPVVCMLRSVRYSRSNCNALQTFAAYQRIFSHPLLCSTILLTFNFLMLHSNRVDGHTGYFNLSIRRSCSFITANRIRRSCIISGILEFTSK